MLWSITLWTEASNFTTEDRGDLLVSQGEVGPEIERRIVKSALRWIKGSEYPPRADAVENITMGFLNGDRRTIFGSMINRDKDVLRFTREYDAVRETVWRD